MKSKTSHAKHMWKLGLRQTTHELSLSTSLQDVAETPFEDELAHWLLDYTFSNPLPSFSWAEASKAEFDCLRPDVEMRVVFHYDGTL